MNLGSSQRFFYCRLRNLFTVFFSVSRGVLAFSGKLVSVYKGGRFLRWRESGRVVRA